MILGAEVDCYVSLRRCSSESVFKVLKKPLGVQPSSLASSHSLWQREPSG
jgi:hypothetical protein